MCSEGKDRYFGMVRERWNQRGRREQAVSPENKTSQTERETVRRGGEGGGKGRREKGRERREGKTDRWGGGGGGEGKEEKREGYSLTTADVLPNKLWPLLRHLLRSGLRMSL